MNMELIKALASDGSRFAQLAALRGAVKLEAIGMRHSSGRSMTASAKRLYGLTGNRASVLAQLSEMIAKVHEMREAV